MVRLTADVLLRADNYLNTYGDREVCLRGLRAPAIENLSVLQDQYDVIDFCDNDIKKLDNFPPMRRLNTVILCNNSISKVGSTLGENVPRLQAIILTNNRINHLYEIDHLATVKNLEVLSLLENPITLKPNYRLYCIHRITGLKALDFNKVTQQEREEAKRLFKSSAGKAFLQSIEREKQQLNAAASQRSGAEEKKAAIMELTDEQKEKVKIAIENATSKEDIDTIEYQLQTGTFPFDSETSENGNAVAGAVNESSIPASAKTAAVVADDMDLD